MTSVASPPPKIRHAGLQTLRATTTIAVVALHAAIAYTVYPFPGLAWPTHDDPSQVADNVAWLANAFVMPVFFLLGGYGVAKLAERFSPLELAKNRLHRLGLPFLFGCVVILPLDLYSWLLGFAADGRIPLRKLQSLKLDPTISDGLFGPAHLWFLQYLILFSCGYALVSWLTKSSVADKPKQQRVASFLTTTSGLTTIALVGAIPLCVDPLILLGFRHEILPQLTHILFFAPMFAFGILWSQSEQAGEASFRFGWKHIAAGLALWLVSMPLRQTFLAQESADMSIRIVTAASYTLAGWFIAAGLFGIAIRSRRANHPAVDYVASASFWIYLFHHPVVGLIHTSLKTITISSDIKFALTLILALALSVAMFEVCVRRTWIGRLLGIKPFTATQPEERVVIALPTTKESAPTHQAAA